MLSARGAGGAAALACATLVGALALPATTAQAADRTVSGGRLDWGIKSSFQSYVTGPIAQGSFSLQGGAATVGGSQFRFHSATGTYDPDTGAFRAGFSGAVHFVGHKKAGGYELDLTIGRPTVRITGGTGTLYADMVSKEKGTGKVTSTAQVPLAALNLSGVNMKGGTSPVALNGIPATLTAQGAKAFAGYYTAGTPLDPVSLSADVRQDTQPSSPPPKQKKPEKPKADAETKSSAGRIEDAAVDWGVRRTFREYVTGSIADGKWTLTAGAQDGGALFRFPRGEGTYREKTLDARFAGTVRFTGKQGLDLALSKVAVTTKGDRGTLYADVASKEFSGKKVPLVTFDTGGLKSADGLVTVVEAPAELTARGAEAFGGMYRAGTAMDPVSLAVALDSGAALPALPDLGSDPSPTPTKTAEPAAKPREAASATDSSSVPVLPLAVGAGVLLAAGAAFGVIRARRTKDETGKAG
ncbi:HtaA domain-containing protein [Streptomyces sp. NPDC091292]|uniref:HtaA domain-containing protein n=1 Tax=Streptomyces sp. NPDC091292 TaxID=3365991 RepID=UPI00382693E9